LIFAQYFHESLPVGVEALTFDPAQPQFFEDFDQKNWQTQPLMGETSEVCFLMFLDVLNLNLKSICLKSLLVLSYQICWLCLFATI